MPPQRSTTATSSGIEVWEAAQLPAAGWGLVYCKDLRPYSSNSYKRLTGSRPCAKKETDNGSMRCLR